MRRYPRDNEKIPKGIMRKYQRDNEKSSIEEDRQYNSQKIPKG